MTGVLTAAQRAHGADDLVVEWHGANGLVRRRDERPPERLFEATLPRAAGRLAVLVSAPAQGHPALEDLVIGLLAERVRPGGDIHTVWLGLAGIGRDRGVWHPLVNRVQQQFQVDVVAPDGVLAGAPSKGLYVGPGTGSVGWRRFQAGGGPSTVLSTRFPMPVWERVLPPERIGTAGLVADPVLAGLLVRSDPAPPPNANHPVFRAPVNQAQAKLLVEDPHIRPNQVAAILGMFAPAFGSGLLVVPLHASIAGLSWISQLADLRQHDIIFSPGVQLGPELPPLVPGAGGFHPFPAVLRQRSGAVEQQVVEIAPPPPGWRPHAPHGYQLGESGPVADVVPGGLVLREATTPAPLSHTFFDPHGWTLTVGLPGGTVAVELVAATERLLRGIEGDRVRTVRIRVDGAPDAAARQELTRIAREAGVPIEFSAPAALPALTDPARTAVVVDTPAITDPTGVGRNAAMVVPPPTLASMPVSVVSGPGPALSMVSDPDSARVPTTEPEPAPAPAPIVAPAQPDMDDQVLVVAKPLAERASTSGEQTRFSAAAGIGFNEGLSIVNSALATWPALRRSDAGAKADYVAVSMYLSRGPAGAVAVNRALRAGREVPIESYLACLVSGLARLPVHRRPVLRQGRLDERWAVGSLVTDPGFVSASVGHNATIAGAEADLLIWPRSARRTAELALSSVIEEAVFLPGRRFKTLAVRTAEKIDDDDGPTFPRTAVLLREVVPDESDTETEDATALARLDVAWERRRRIKKVRVLDDPDVVTRLTMPMVPV